MQADEIKALKKAVEDHQRRLLKLEQVAKPGAREAAGDIGGVTPAAHLARKTGVSEQKISEIFDIEENSLTVVKMQGENERDQTQNITLAALLGYKYFFDTEELLSQEIRRNVAENNVKVNNFSTHVNQMSPSLIRRKGKPKSPTTTYKLTTLGEARARELLKQMAGT